MSLQITLTFRQSCGKDGARLDQCKRNYFIKLDLKQICYDLHIWHWKMVQGYCIYPFLTSAIYVNYKPGRAKEREYKVWTMVFFLQIWLWPLTYKLCQNDVQWPLTYKLCQRSLYILYQKVLYEWIMSQVCMAKGREYMAWTMILNKIKIMEIFMHTYTSNTSNLGFV